MKIYKNIKKLFTFSGFEKKQGRFPERTDFKPIKDAAMIVDQGVIQWVGKEKNLPRVKGGKAFDLKGQNVFPSFTESHTHLVFGGDRKNEFEKKIAGATYQEISQAGGGIKSTMKDTKKASSSELLELAQKRVQNFKKQGVGLLEVKSGYGGDFKTEKKILDVAFQLKGLKVVPTYLALHTLPLGKSHQEYVDQVINKDLPKMKKAFPGLSRADIFVEKNYFSLEDLRKISEKASELRISLCAHVDQLSSGGGAVEASKLGALSVEHAVFLNEKEREFLAKSETVINLLPGADFYLKTPYPQARKLIDSGCRVSLATDFNPGSSPTQNLSFIGALARREMKMSLPEVWCAYTYNASQALGVKNKGILKKGYSASFFTSEADPEDFFYQVGEHPVVKAFV